MKDKRVIAGIAIGVAALAAVGLAFAYKKKKSKKQKFIDAAQDASERFRHKLDILERRAKKEYRDIVEEGREATNRAKDRATEWVNKTTLHN